MLGLFNIWCDPKFDNIMYRKELVKNQGLFYLTYYGWYFDCPLDCTPILEKSKRKKFNSGCLEKLDSFQGNKEDIDKRRKKKEDVQVSGTPRVIQTHVDIENREHDENPELFKF
jgi:hypothetical protein